MSDPNPHGDAWLLELTELRPNYWQGILDVPGWDKNQPPLSFHGTRKGVIENAKRYKKSELFRLEAEKRAELLSI